MELVPKTCPVKYEPKEFKEVDGGNFLRLKMKLDLSLPLCHGHLISRMASKFG